MSILNHSILTKSYGKLFAKTNSASASWSIKKINVNVTTQYTIIDNVNGNIVKQNNIDSNGTISADLSVTSGDCSIYLDVDDTGNDATYLYLQFNKSKLYYLDFGLFPLLSEINLTNGTTCQVVNSDLLNLESVYFGGGTWNGLDFSQTTKIKVFTLRYEITTDIPINISNNPLITYLSLWYTYYPTISISNHPLLEYIHLEDQVNAQIDVNINNTFLPNLRRLDVYRSKSQDYDFSTRNLDKLTYLSISAKIISNQHLLTDLQELLIYSDNITPSDTVNHVLDLKPILNLKKFILAKSSALTEIQINNGLNTQILNFQRNYAAGTIDVVVDNPTDANNGVAPYLPTVWKEYGTNNSWNFI